MSEEERKRIEAAQLATELAQAEKQRVHLHSMLWAQFATGAIAQNGRSVQYATATADEMLEEWIARFEESEDGDE